MGGPSGGGLSRSAKLFLAVAVLCSMLTKIPWSTEGGSQRISLGTGPEVGTVADLTWGVSHADIDREVVAMRDAGIVWVRANQNWAAGEAEGKGVSNEGWMAEVDYAVTKARAAGLQVLMPIADGVPYWASADPSKYVDAAGVRHWNKLWRPTHNSDYAAFAAAMVNRYKPMGVRTYEVWNEPNHPFFWPSGPSAADYKELLAAAYPAIKGADPGATVLVGGLSKNDWDYMADLYAAGAGPYFDVANVHPYTGTVDPTWCWNQAGTTKPAKDAFCGIEEIRRTMVANGDSAKNMWITEFGWSTTTAAYGVSEATQADFLTKALTKAEREYPYVTTAFWYSFRNPIGYEHDPTNLEANWGLVKGDLTPKPAFTAVQAFTSLPPPVSLSVSNATVVEGGPGATTDATFTVSLSEAATETVSVKAATANSSAVAGSDYTALPLTTLTFAPGETTRTVAVPIRGDSVVEGNEYFSLNLSARVGALWADTYGLGTILDEEGPPALSISSPTGVDGPPGTATEATFAVSLSAPAAQTVSVKAATANSSAVAGSDYTAMPLTTLTFAPGETTRTVAVAVSGDAVTESNEYFVVNLSAPVGAVVADGQGLGTIVEDQGPPTIAINDPTVIEGGPAPAGTAIFTISLSAPAAQTVSVKAATANSSAVAGSDYTALPPTTVTFAPGETTKTVGVGIVADQLAQGERTFVVNLSAPVGGVLADGQGAATIVDDEGAPTVGIADLQVGEGASGAGWTAIVTVFLSAPAAQAVSVKAATADASATAGPDYTAVPPTTLTFAPGEKNKTVAVPITGDSVAETDESFVVNLSAPVGATLADNQAVVTVDDDDGLLELLDLGGPSPVIYIGDAAVVEGSPGTTTQLTFTVWLSAPAPLLLGAIGVATSGGSATAGADFTALPASTTVAFGLGETAKTVSVPIPGDSLAEGNETFTVNLTAPPGASVGDGSAVGTVLDDEGLPTLAVRNTTVVEGGPGTTTSANVTVSLSAAAAQTVSVKVATSDSTATAGSDYTAQPLTTLAFAPGETTRTVAVAVRGDSASEENEHFAVNLSGRVGALWADTYGLVTIIDDEGPPSLSIADATAVEGGPGVTAEAAFTVSLSAPAAQPVSVKAATANWRASAGSDYTAVPLTTVSFAPGETTKRVVVPITGDGLAEGDETFVVNLVSAVGAMLADFQALGTILDEEGPPTISVTNAHVQEVGAATFTVSLSAPAAQAVTVKAATADSGAAAGSDYVAVPSTTLTFAPGETAKTVAVTIVADTATEGDETFAMNLSAPVAAVLADGQGVGTIVDDH